MGFRLVTACTENLQITTTSNYSAIINPHTHQFRLLYLRQSLVMNRLYPCWPYWLVNFTSLIFWIPSQGSPQLYTCTAYNISAWAAQKTDATTVLSLLHMAITGTAKTTIFLCCQFMVYNHWLQSHCLATAVLQLCGCCLAVSLYNTTPFPSWTGLKYYTLHIWIS
jgi:hypothetical protein